MIIQYRLGHGEQGWLGHENIRRNIWKIIFGGLPDLGSVCIFPMSHYLSFLPGLRVSGS